MDQVNTPQQTPATPPDQITAVKPEAVKRSLKWMKKVIAGIIAAIIFIPIITLLLCMYAFNLRNSTIDAIAKAVPLPVAQVNGHFLTYADWRAGVATVNHFYDQKEQLGLSGSLPDLTQEQIESNELDRLIERELLNELAKQFNVTVSKDEINQEYQTTIVPQATDETEIANTIQTMYGWTIDQFKEEVVNEVVMRRKLQDAMNADGELNKAAKEKIDQVKVELDGGADFGEVAKKNSEDSSAVDGGDLGWVEKGQTVPEFETIAFSTAVGSTSDIFTSVYGYHILKVMEVDGEKIKVAHILTKFISIDDKLKSMKDSAKIQKWVKVVDLTGSALDTSGQ